MTGERRDACEGKEAFASFKIAENTSGRSSNRRHCAFQVYHCPHCHKFHIGRPAVAALRSGRRPRIPDDDGED